MLLLSPKKSARYFFVRIYGNTCFLVLKEASLPPKRKALPVETSKA
jgi:hypothetical protein